MAATDAEFQQNAGTPEQLPQGAASDLNEALPSTTPSEPELPEGAAPEVIPLEDVPVLPAEAKDFEPMFAAETEEDDFITSPTFNPDESQAVGAARRVPLSPRLRRSLPLLQKLAAEPSASPQLRALVSLLLREAR